MDLTLSKPLAAIKKTKSYKAVVASLWQANPVSKQILGICSALAVTVQLKTALVMSCALTFVVAFSSLIISCIRNFIPRNIRIIVEISVLTPPETINVDKPDRYLDHIELGRDGLIVSREGHRGILLPQVPVDQGWDVEDFLTNCCLKAWLPPDSWLDPQTKIEKFQANIFEEEAPGGSVIRVELDRH